MCELCRPLDGVKITRQELRALWPRHPGCRCFNLPVPIVDDGDGVGGNFTDEPKDESSVIRSAQP